MSVRGSANGQHQRSNPMTRRSSAIASRWIDSTSRLESLTRASRSRHRSRSRAVATFRRYPQLVGIAPSAVPPQRCGDTSARQGVVVASKRSHGRITVWRTVLLLTAAAVALLAAAAAMAASHGDSSEADRLRATETTRLQALVAADTATARTLMAPDFQVINPRRRRVRARGLHGGYRGRGDRLPRVRARVADRSTTLRRLRRASLPGELRPGRRRRHAGHTPGMDHRTLRAPPRNWQIVWEQATAIPNNFGLFVESIKPVS